MTSAQLAGSASVLPRVSPLTPTRCNLLPWDLSPENRCQTWDTRAKFRILIVYNEKFEGRPFETPTSAQLAGDVRVLVRVSPLTPTRCNSVALGLKPREYLSNLGPPGRISYFIANINGSSGVRRLSPRPRPN